MAALSTEHVQNENSKQFLSVTCLSLFFLVHGHMLKLNKHVTCLWLACHMLKQSSHILFTSYMLNYMLHVTDNHATAKNKHVYIQL